MALEILTIASSSKGNCIGIKNGSHIILIDMGISLCHLKTALLAHRINIENIDAVIITHEHSDHILGLKTLLKHYNIPIYTHRDTMSAICSRLMLDVKSYDISETGFSIGEIDIQPFRTRHDAVYSLGYSFMDNSGKISIATDLGVVTDGVMNNIKGSDIVFLESNHDVKMLKCGDYPQHIKNRILSNVGHISNDTCAETSMKLVDSGTRTIILGHLSENNNTRRLAYSVTAEELNRHGVVIGRDVLIDVAASNSVYVRYSTEDSELRKII